ncbi:MAG: T9SS type A sorting domain-containing protein [Bacteroidetes bacterium]|nr:MAG: T9SS type A sorting domain-containing protein [Bacteroidota bacterium]
MKLILLLFLFSLALHANSQTSVYHPFPDSNATWCVEQSGGGGPCVFVNTIYRLERDSTINGMQYRRMLHYSHIETRDCSTNQLTFWTYNSTTYYIRQDTSLRKIWLLNLQTQQDEIMYDFNYIVGDTLSHLNTYWGDNCHDCVITSIDSVLIGSDYRKRFNYQPSCYWYPTDTSMIEGIGATHGLLYGPSCFESSNWLKEFNQNSINLYTNPFTSFSYPACQQFVSVSEINFSIPSKIYPNPFSDYATLEIPELYGPKILLNIFNSTGALVRKKIISEQKSRLDKLGLKSGFYFFQLLNDKGETGSGNFVIE